MEQMVRETPGITVFELLVYFILRVIKFQIHNKLFGRVARKNFILREFRQKKTSLSLTGATAGTVSCIQMRPTNFLVSLRLCQEVTTCPYVNLFLNKVITIIFILLFIGVGAQKCHVFGITWNIMC